ncbi:unnamed protein product, partial [Pylaiella littoralis]
LLWVSHYDGNGDVASWTSEEQAEFWNSGARFLPVHRMVEGLEYLTKGVVEGETSGNPHFCMPGPPNEIGILVLRVAWSLHDERVRREKKEEKEKEGEEGKGKGKETGTGKETGKEGGH